MFAGENRAQEDESTTRGAERDEAGTQEYRGRHEEPEWRPRGDTSEVLGRR
jgi:hypothetical protein